MHLGDINTKEDVSAFAAEAGLRIRSARTAHGMSQQKLSEAVGVSVQAVSYWEKGKAFPSFMKLLMLSTALDVSLDYLVGRQPERANLGQWRWHGDVAIDIVHLSNAFKYSAGDVETAESLTVATTYPTYTGHALMLGYLIDDNSMSPLFDLNDLIIVDRSFFPLAGDFCILRSSDRREIVLRKVRISRRRGQSRDDLELYPLNGDYPTEIVSSENFEDILGVVVEHRKFRTSA